MSFSDPRRQKEHLGDDQVRDLVVNRRPQENETYLLEKTGIDINARSPRDVCSTTDGDQHRILHFSSDSWRQRRLLCLYLRPPAPALAAIESATLLIESLCEVLDRSTLQNTPLSTPAQRFPAIVHSAAHLVVAFHHVPPMHR